MLAISTRGRLETHRTTHDLEALTISTVGWLDHSKYREDWSSAGGGTGGGEKKENKPGKIYQDEVFFDETKTRTAMLMRIKADDNAVIEFLQNFTDRMELGD